MEQQLQAEPGLLGLEPINLAKHLNGGNKCHLMLVNTKNYGMQNERQS